MFTIEIPVWLQWAGLSLAVAYAVPKALRVVIVTLAYLLSAASRSWPLRTRDQYGEAKVQPWSAAGRSDHVYLDVIGWAFGNRPVFTEDELAIENDDSQFAAGEVVQLRSGGPSMTVSGTERKPDGSTMVEVDWFDGSTAQRAAYPPAQLIAQDSSHSS